MNVTERYDEAAAEVAEKIESEEAEVNGPSDIEGVSRAHLRNIRKETDPDEHGGRQALEAAIEARRPRRRSEMSDSERAAYVREHGKDEYLNLPE